MAHDGLSRRRFFFYGTLLAGAVPAGGFGSTPSLKTLGYKSRNEKLNIASIGAGGKAESDIRGCAETENIVALCDVDEKRAAKTLAAYAKIPKYNDYRKMLDKEAKNIDAVIVAIPDFMHTCAAMACMELGKHVYVQKPMARTVWECRALTQAARHYKVATQMGNQGYAQEGARLCSEMIWSGAIGNVLEVHAFTNRPIWPQGLTEPPKEDKIPETLNWDAWLGIAADRPYSPAYVPHNWRGFYDFGCGALGDMACHVLGAPNMALLLTAPTSVECIKIEGKSAFTFPLKSTIKFEFPARGSMPPVTLYWEDGEKNGSPYRPEGIPADEPLGEIPERLVPGPIYAALTAAAAAARGGGGGRGAAPPAGAAGAAAAGAAAPTAAAKAPAPIPTPTSGVVFVGDKGSITAGEYGGGARLVPMSKMNDYRQPPQFLTRAPGPAAVATYRDWIRACKGGDPSCSNFGVAGPFTEWIALGVIACRIPNTKLLWDSAKMRVTNNAEADKYIKPYIRKGWKINWKVTL
jgi:hypothetical protein